MKNIKIIRIPVINEYGYLNVSTTSLVPFIIADRSRTIVCNVIFICAESGSNPRVYSEILKFKQVSFLISN